MAMKIKISKTLLTCCVLGKYDASYSCLFLGSYDTVEINFRIVKQTELYTCPF